MTDPLDFSSPESQLFPEREMMKAVGDKYAPQDEDLGKVIPLARRGLIGI